MGILSNKEYLGPPPRMESDDLYVEPGVAATKYYTPGPFFLHAVRRTIEEREEGGDPGLKDKESADVLWQPEFYITDGATIGYPTQSAWTTEHIFWMDSPAWKAQLAAEIELGYIEVLPDYFQVRIEPGQSATFMGVAVLGNVFPVLEELVLEQTSPESSGMARRIISASLRMLGRGLPILEKWIKGVAYATLPKERRLLDYLNDQESVYVDAQGTWMRVDTPEENEWFRNSVHKRARHIFEVELQRNGHRKISALAAAAHVITSTVSGDEDRTHHVANELTVIDIVEGEDALLERVSTMEESLLIEADIQTVFEIINRRRLLGGRRDLSFLFEGILRSYQLSA